MQHVVIECARVRDLLMVLKAALSSSGGDVMIPLSPYQLHKKWEALISKIGMVVEVPSVGDQCLAVGRHFTPASIRPGVATADFLQLQSASRVQWRGRWADQKVLRHYLQMGSYYLAGLDFSPWVRARMDHYRSALDTFMRSVPDFVG